MTADALKIIKGSQRYHIYPKIDHSPASFTLINLKVDDIEQVVDDLTSAGVNFEQYDQPEIKTNPKGIAEHESKKMAWLKDPDGNIRGLLQGNG